MKKTDILTKIVVGRVEPSIYAFTTNTIPNYLKIGDTYRPVTTRLNEWKKIYPDLTKEYEEKAIINDDVFFRDYSVHQFIEEELHRIRLFEDQLETNTYYSNEFFKDTSKEDVKEAIKDIKSKYLENSSTYKYYDARTTLPEIYRYASTGTWTLRPNQAEVVNNFKKAVKKGRTNLLMYAVMRFGKSFTSLSCAKEIDANVVVIVSAKADVKEEWKKTIESADNFNEYKFISSDDLFKDTKLISSKLLENKKVVIFLTLQDLQGEEIKEKHKEIFEHQINLLIIDETHFGARAEKYGYVLRDDNYVIDVKDKYAAETEDLAEANDHIKILNAEIKLHLSGTPYRILMGSEFSEEDIICFCQFTDIAKAQSDWDKENILRDVDEDGKQVKEWDNPYYGFPQMIRFAFNPSSSARKKLAEYKKMGHTYAFSSLFKPKSIKKSSTSEHKYFINEKEILELLEVIDGSKDDEYLLGFLDYDNIKTGNMCRHIVIVLPYCASCDALEHLINNNKNIFKNLNQYKIINISGVDNPSKYRATNDVKTKIIECENEGQKTITLTVNRMLTGTTVQEWDTMLYFKDTASPQEYDQSIFRLQNQFIKEYVNENGEVIKYNMKPQTLLVDFDPARMFALQEQKSLIYNANIIEKGNSLLKERIEQELAISPIITINKNKITEITPEDIMQSVSNYSRSKGILDETNEIPVDLSLLNFDVIRNVIKKQSELGSNKGLFVENAKGDGDNLDIPELEEVSDSDDELKSVVTESNNEEKANKIDPVKQFRTYYAKVLFYAFLTKGKVMSLGEILTSIDNPNNDRIASNLGLEKDTLNLIFNNINPYVLNQLDYKIFNINNLANDETIKPIGRAVSAFKKFSKISDSEFITSPEVCDRMLNLVSDTEFSEIIENDGKFIDIASKMAEFPIAIYRKTINQLNYDHQKIKDNIYAIPTSPIAYEFTRKIYETLKLNTDNIASKFDSYDIVKIRKLDSNGNLIKDLDLDKIVKLLSQDKKFYEIELEDNIFTKEGDKELNFDLVIGNPPYHISDGGALASASPIYHYFDQISGRISLRFNSLIIPARWFIGGKGLDQFRKDMLDDTSIRELHDCLTPEDVFPNTNIRGGICYFLRDKLYNNLSDLVKVVTHENNYIVDDINRAMRISDHEVFIRDGRAETIIDKINKGHSGKLIDYVSSRNPFGFATNFINMIGFKKETKDLKEPIVIFANKGAKGYIDKKSISKNLDWIDKWKVLTPYSNNIGTELKDDNLNTIISPPNSICTETYLVIGADLELNEDSVKNLEKYMQTKFFRYLISILKNSQHGTKGTYRFVPLQDYSADSDINWSNSINDIDKQLYEKYGFDQEEIQYINSKIKDM